MQSSENSPFRYGSTGQLSLHPACLRAKGKTLVMHKPGASPPDTRPPAPVLGVPFPYRLAAVPRRRRAGDGRRDGGVAFLRWLRTGGGGLGAGKAPSLRQGLQRPDAHTVSHPTARDGGGFDRLESLVLGGAVVQGAAHVGGHAILQTAGRQDPQHNEFLHEMMPGCPTACGGEEWHPC